MSASDQPFRFTTDDEARIAPGLDIGALEGLLSRLPVSERDWVRESFEVPAIQGMSAKTLKFSDPRLQDLVNEVWAPRWQGLGAQEFQRRDQARRRRSASFTVAISTEAATDPLSAMVVLRRTGEDLVVLASDDPRVAFEALTELRRRRAALDDNLERDSVIMVKPDAATLLPLDDPSVQRAANLISDLAQRQPKPIPGAGRVRSKTIVRRVPDEPPGWDLARRRLGLAATNGADPPR